MAAQKSDDPEPFAQITLRVPASVKERLNEHCAFRQRVEGRSVSYNQAMLDLIRTAPVRRSPSRRRASA